MNSPTFSINASEVSAERFDNEVMIVNLVTGNYYSLTGVAADVWQLIGRGCSRDAILKEVQASYRGNSEAIRDDLDAFIAELEQERIVVAGDPASADTPSSDSMVTTSGSVPDREFATPRLEKYTDMQELLLVDPIHEVNDEHGWPKMKP
jgi:hypothetical protein